MDLSLLTMRWQQRVVAALVLLSPVVVWRSIDDQFGLPKATLTALACVAVLALGVVRAVAERRVLVPHHPLVWATVAFLGALVITTLLSSNRALSIVGSPEFYAGLLGTVACVAIALVVARVFDESWAGLVLAAFVAGAALCGAYAVVQRLDADPFTWGYNALGFTFSTMGNPNFAAGVAGIAAPIGAGLALRPSWSPVRRILAGGGAAVCLVGAVATTSFQGVVAAAAGVAVVGIGWLAANREHARERVGGRALLVIGGGVVVLAALAIATVDDVGNAVEDGLRERRLIWRAAVDVVADDPLFGSGPDTFGQVFLAHRPAEHAVQFSYSRADQAHDVPLNMFATGGVLVGGTYLAVVVLTGLALVRGLRVLEGDRALLLGAAGGGWLAYHVQALVSLDTPTLLLWHWVLTALVFVLALDPPFAEYALPGPTPARGRARSSQPRVGGAVLAGVVVAALAVAWFATRPLRSQLAVQRAQDTANVGDLAGARSEAEKATDLAGWSSLAWLTRTQMEEASQEVLAAVDSADHAARVDHGSPELAIVAATLAQRYRPEQPNPWWDEAIRRDPNGIDTLVAVAHGLSTADPEHAEEIARRAVEVNDASATAWSALGDVLLAADDRDGARDAYERSLELDPSGPANTGMTALEGGDA